MIKGKLKPIVSWLLVVIALTMLMGQTVYGAIPGEEQDIPITRWVCHQQASGELERTVWATASSPTRSIEDPPAIPGPIPDPIPEENFPPESRWACPYTQPMTFEEWRRQQPPPAPFVVHRICRRDILGLGQPPPGAPRVAIIVHHELRRLIQKSLDQYKIDLRNEGWAADIFCVQGGNASDLRVLLQGIPGLVGAVLIGDVPVAMFRDYDVIDNEKRRIDFPIDLYFMDLDGVWTDTDDDGRYDKHSGDTAPEIWVGRLKASNLTVLENNQRRPVTIKEQADFINRYFARNHEWRHGRLRTNERALVYVDDCWVGGWSCPARKRYREVGYAYATRTLVKDQATTRAADYKNRLRDNYEWISVAVHSYARGHGFYINGVPEIDQEGQRVFVRYYDIRDIRPVATFYNLFACSAARFIERDNIGKWYIFAGDHGLAVIGTTEVGSMRQRCHFYKPLGRGESLGCSFKQWFNAVHPFSRREQQRFYGLTILGDPTLRPTVPQLQVTPTTISASLEQGAGWTGTISVTNPGEGTLSWSERDNRAWIGATPNRGTTTTETDLVTVRLTTAGLAVGKHTGTISFTGAGITKTVQVTLAVLCEYDIALEPGWNLISLPLVPEDPAIEVVLAGIMDYVIRVWQFDAETGTWKGFAPGDPLLMVDEKWKYSPPGPPDGLTEMVDGKRKSFTPTGVLLATLTEMVDGKGYWIAMEAAVTLTVIGTEVPLPPAPPSAYPVFEGWNHIGFRSITPMPVEEYLGDTIMDIFVLMWGFDAETDSWFRVFPVVYLEPGRGYWLSLSGNGTIYP